jgi:hypothetical protein
MRQRKRRYVAKGVAGEGWRVWDNKQKRLWGNPFTRCPDELLDELNGPKRPEKVTELVRILQKEHRRRTQKNQPHRIV